MTDADPFDLDRFVQAQDGGGAHDAALQELRRGRKTGHWMWFVLPQLAGLGRSPTARHFALRSLQEARAYLAHPVLGARLREAAEAARTAPATSADALLGVIDARKLRSSMTLFLRAAPDEQVFQAVLDRWYGGQADPATDRLLSGS